MILDRIENLRLYAGINKHIAAVADFIDSHNLSEMPQGRVELCGDLCFANFCTAHGRKREDAFMESHNRMIDLQIVFDAEEEIGYRPRTELTETEYHADGDYSVYPGQPCRDYFMLRPGEFIMLLPDDAHAPLITDADNYHKVIFKISVE